VGRKKKISSRISSTRCGAGGDMAGGAGPPVGMGGRGSAPIISAERAQAVGMCESVVRRAKRDGACHGRRRGRLGGDLLPHRPSHLIRRGSWGRRLRACCGMKFFSQTGYSSFHYFHDENNKPYTTARKPCSHFFCMFCSTIPISSHVCQNHKN
jgi:hypothetical protein